MHAMRPNISNEELTENDKLSAGHARGEANRMFLLEDVSQQARGLGPDASVCVEN